jgi:hypothetical protein
MTEDGNRPFEPSGSSCPADGVLDALIPLTAEAFFARFASPAFVANPAFFANGTTFFKTMLPAAWPSGVAPSTATQRAVADRTSGSRCLISSPFEVVGGARG